MAEQVAWVGLGNMGRGMVRNIIQKHPLQSPLLIYNRTASRTLSFAATLPPSCIQIATSIPELASASTILTCIADDRAMTAFINEILPYCSTPKLFIDCSTIHPSTTEEIAKLVTDAGHTFVAMPVFGAPAMADAGQLVCVPAGPAAAVERALPFAKVVGRQTINLSGQPYGAASKLKIVGNQFILNMVTQLAEGHLLAEASGLGSETLHQFISAILPGPYVGYSARMMTGDYYTRDEPLFATELAIKDCRHALSLAEEAEGNVQGKVDLKNSKTGMERLMQVKERTGPNGDWAGIYGLLREEAGLPWGNQPGQPGPGKDDVEK